MGLYRPVRSTPCGARLANGTCWVVAAPGFAPGRPLGHILLRDAWLLFHQAAGGAVHPREVHSALPVMYARVGCSDLPVFRSWTLWVRVVPVLGTSPLNGQSPHRAMFAYPCRGKTTPWPSYRLHVQRPRQSRVTAGRNVGPTHSTPRHASAPRHPEVGASVMRLSPALTGRGFGAHCGCAGRVPPIE